MSCNYCVDSPISSLRKNKSSECDAHVQFEWTDFDSAFFTKHNQTLEKHLDVISICEAEQAWIIVRDERMQTASECLPLKTFPSVVQKWFDNKKQSSAVCVCACVCSAQWAAAAYLWGRSAPPRVTCCASWLSGEPPCVMGWKQTLSTTRALFVGICRTSIMS